MLEEVSAVINRNLKVVSVRDCVFGAGLHTESAENAAAVIDVINFCVALVAANPFGVGAGVGFGLDIDAVRRASGRAQIAGYAFLLAVFIHVEQVLSAVTRLDSYGYVRILDSPLLARNFI